MSATPEPTLRPLRWRHLICFGVALALVALDLWSKVAVFELLDQAQAEGRLVRDDASRPYLPWLGHWLNFMENYNYGAAFGFFASFAYVLVPLRAVALVVVSILILRAPRGHRVYLTSLVLIVAGAAGNLYDNLFNLDKKDFDVLGMTVWVGPVRDFIDFHVPAWNWHFATFNVADSCISVGAVLLILSGLGPKSAEPQPAPGAGPRGQAGGPTGPLGGPGRTPASTPASTSTSTSTSTSGAPADPSVDAGAGADDARERT